MKPLRVALSGSGFKFPAHVGALLAIEDAGYSVIEYAGTSGGSIIAALAASGLSPAAMKALTLAQDWSGMLTLTIGSLLARQGYCNGCALHDWIDGRVLGQTFEDVATDLVIMSSDITHGVPFKWSRETTPTAPIALAARASASIPFAYAPVLYDAAMHMDGGMANNLPIMKLTADLVPRLGIQLVAKGSPLPPGMHDVLMTAGRQIELMLSTNESSQVLMAKEQGATIVQVETGYASGLDRNMSVALRRRLMNDGYAAAWAALYASKMTPHISMATAEPNAIE